MEALTAMAKMFYSLAEAANKLGKSEDDVRNMAQKGEITEFRDGDDLIFKVDQIDLLAGDDSSGEGDDSMIPLSDTGLGSGMGLSDSGQSSGISVFDADELEEADPSAVTQVTDSPDSGGAPDLDAVSLESFGSGSGLMDLTRDADDTSAGAEGLLDDLYAGEDDASGETVGESQLFEGAASAGELQPEPAGATGGAVAAEAIDPKFSSFSAGLMLGVLLAAAGATAFIIMGVVGRVPDLFATFMGGDVLILTGILLGAALLLGVLFMLPNLKK